MDVFYVFLAAIVLIFYLLIVGIYLDVDDKLFEQKKKSFSKRVKFYSDDALVEMLSKSKHQYWKSSILRNELLRRGKNK